MKKYIIIIILISNISFSQIKKDYDIILKFNSLDNEISIRELNIDDEKFIYFTISKTIKNYKPPYSLGVNNNGKLHKRIRGSSSSGYFIKGFSYKSKEHKMEKILRINPKNNIITYEDFKNVTIDNFLEIIENAKKVYVMDSGKDDETSLYYNVYEVSF